MTKKKAIGLSEQENKLMEKAQNKSFVAFQFSHCWECRGELVSQLSHTKKDIKVQNYNWHAIIICNSLKLQNNQGDGTVIICCITRCNLTY